MERQGTCIHNHVNSRQYVGASMHVLVFLAVFFFFVVDGWSSCRQVSCSLGVYGCRDDPTGCINELNDYVKNNICPEGIGEPFRSSSVCGTALGYCGSFLINGVAEYSSAKGNVIVCETPCEAERERCLAEGLDFDADSCKCKMPCPESVCDAYKTQCENVLMGSFTGRCERSGAGGEPCCNGYCDICGGPGIQGNYNEMKKICCGQFKAPPSIGNVCWQNPAFSSGCHVYQSTVRAPDGEQWACHDPNQSQEMMDRYMNECFGGSSSSTGGSSSSGGSSEGGGGSSEGGGGSSAHNPYPEGCEECPWLDSILDTLTAQKSTVDQIYTCVKYPSLCDPNALNETIVEIDSNILNGVKDLIDSSLELSNEQIEALLKLDTNTLKMLKLDSASLANDTLTRLAILSVGGDIQDSLSNVRHSVVHMNDTTRKWLRRLADSLSAQNDSNRKYLEMVADSIGVTAESLKVHLDSIKNAIPRDILDSILKYQKELADDSIVISSFPGLDSMIDTVVHYWTKIMHNDSAFQRERNDSTKAIHDAIKDIGINIGSVLGYGDTATTDLHQDILILRDSLLNSLKVLRDKDSSYRQSMDDTARALHDAIDGISVRMGAILGYGDTATSDLRRDIDAMRGDVNIFRDSAIKYFGAFISADSSYKVIFKDSIGSLHGAIDGVKGSVEGVGNAVEDIKGMLSEGSYDTSSLYDGYLSGYDTSAVKFVSDIGEAVSGAMHDSTYRRIFSIGSSSSGDLGDMSLPDLDSAGRALRANVDSSYNAIGENLEGVFDTLRREFVLINWDSAIVAPLGMKVPNTNTCPEDCFAIDLSSAGPWFSSITAMTWGLCKPYSVLAGMNVLEFVRLILRIVTALTCVSIGMWFIAGRRN